MAALCHDIGHLPFSHAAETELLPRGKNHESITADLIQGDLMGEIWGSMTPPLRPLDIAKVAVGKKVLRDQEFTDWERLLYEIIGGDALGVDRVDYLLRDSHHAGVAYGRFDHYRMIETMRILPASPQFRLAGTWGRIWRHPFYRGAAAGQVLHVHAGVLPPCAGCLRPAISRSSLRSGFPEGSSPRVGATCKL